MTQTRIPHPPIPLDVVAALMIKDGRILVAQRKIQDSNGGFWEFPGGKVEPGESHAQALIREIQEELAVDIRVGDLIEVREFQSPSGKWIRLHLFVTEVLTDQYVLNEHDDARWVKVEDLETMGFIPGNRLFIEAVKRWFRQKQV